MSRDAIAFAAGLGTGFVTQKLRNKEAERDKERDARDKERHDADMEERRRKVADRQALADAGAERKVIDGTAVDTGQGKNLYTDPAQAEAAAADARAEAEMRGQDPAKVTTTPAQGVTGNMSRGHQITTQPVDVAALNAPEARAKRVAAAQMGIGDVAGSLQTENAIRTGKAADIQLRQAEEANVRDKAFREITEKFVRGGWSAVPKIYEGYNDGNTAQVKPDGKGGALVTVFNPKGEKVHEQAFADEMEFISTAIANVDPKLWVGMREKKAEAARTDARENRKMAETERHNKAMEGIYSQRAAGAGRSGAGAAGQATVGLKDRRDYLDDFAKMLPDPKGALDPTEAGTLLEGNKRALAQADAIFTTNASLGNILTAPQAATAMRLAQDRQNVKVMRDNESGRTYETVVVNGKPVIVGELAQKTAPKAAPGAAPAAAPGQNMAASAGTQAAAAPVDRIGNQPIGPLTPTSHIVESAKAGNKRAIAWIQAAEQARLDDLSAPRTASEMIAP